MRLSGTEREASLNMNNCQIGIIVMIVIVTMTRKVMAIVIEAIIVTIVTTYLEVSGTRFCITTMEPMEKEQSK